MTQSTPPSPQSHPAKSASQPPASPPPSEQPPASQPSSQPPSSQPPSSQPPAAQSHPAESAQPSPAQPSPSQPPSAQPQVTQPQMTQPQFVGGQPQFTPQQQHSQPPGHPGAPQPAGMPGSPAPGAFGPGSFAPAGPVGGRAGFAQVVVAEWTKLRTVRSTMWTLLVLALLVIGMSALLASTVSLDPDDGTLEISQIGVMIGQIAAATLGVLTMSAEYTTGMIRTTLTAYPRRLQVLAAKALVLGGVIFVVSLVCSYLAYAIFQASGKGLDPSSDELFRALVGGSIYMAAIALLGLGFGTILRHSAGAITTLLGIILLPTVIGGFLPAAAQDVVVDYSPMMVLLKVIVGMDEEMSGPGPWPSLWIMCLYSAAALIAGGSLLRSRDV